MRSKFAVIEIKERMKWEQPTPGALIKMNRF